MQLPSDRCPEDGRKSPDIRKIMRAGAKVEPTGADTAVTDGTKEKITSKNGG